MYYQKSGVVNITQNNTTPESNIINAVRSNDFSSVIYGQVLISPSTINFGKVTTDLSENFAIWNANDSSVYLENITEENFDGVAIYGKENGWISSNSVEVYNVVVTAEGGKTIDAYAKFNITDLGYLPTLNILGSRSVLFGFSPDFSGSNTINYSYFTNVKTFYSGNEERHAMFAQPEMNLTNNYLAIGSNARLMQNYLQNIGADTFLLPIYQYVEKTQSEINIGDLEIYIEDVREFTIGEYLMIGQYHNIYAQNEIIDIDEVENKITVKNAFTKSFKSNTNVFPLKEVRFTENNNSLSKITDDVMQGAFNFSLVNNNNILKEFPDVFINNFEGLDVLEHRPDYRSMAASFDFIFEDFKDFGNQERIIQMDRANNNFSYSYVLKNKDEINYFKEFMRRRQGQLGEFYVKSFYQDFKIQQDIEQSSTTILVENNGQASLNSGLDHREAISIELRDGRSIYRKISNFLTDNETTEKIVLFENIGENIKKEDVVRIEFLLRTRFTTDTLSIEHKAITVGRLNLGFKVL